MLHFLSLICGSYSFLLNQLWSEKIKGHISIFLSFLYVFRLDCWSNTISFRESHRLLRSMYILYLLNGMLCSYFFIPIDIWYSLSLKYHCWYYVWNPYLKIGVRYRRLPHLLYPHIPNLLCLFIFVLWNKTGSIFDVWIFTIIISS